MKDKEFIYRFQNSITGIAYISPALILLSLCLFLSSPALAQNKNTNNNNAIVVVVGKPLTAMDSAIVKDIFFNALRQKTIDNQNMAAELFNKVIQIDPLNDASLYELAIIKKEKNNYSQAQQLLERAVTINQDNEYYWLALADCYEKGNDINKL